MRFLLILLLYPNLLRAQTVEGIGYQGGLDECYHQIYIALDKTQVLPGMSKEPATRYFLAKMLVKADGHLGDEITITAFSDTINSAGVIAAIRITDGSWINSGADRLVYLPIIIRVFVNDPEPTPVVPVSEALYLKDSRQPLIRLPPLIIKESDNSKLTR